MVFTITNVKGVLKNENSENRLFTCENVQYMNDFMWIYWFWGELETYHYRFSCTYWGYLYVYIYVCDLWI